MLEENEMELPVEGFLRMVKCQNVKNATKAIRQTENIARRDRH